MKETVCKCIVRSIEIGDDKNIWLTIGMPIPDDEIIQRERSAYICLPESDLPGAKVGDVVTVAVYMK